ncbi:MAG: glycosyltransferase [Alphaproteobacteria bacterium]
MNSSVTTALTYVADLDAGRITVIAPFPLEEMEALALLEDRRIQVHTPAPLPNVRRIDDSQRLVDTSRNGYSAPLAERSGVAIFLGGPSMFPVSDLLTGMLSGRWSIICRIEGRYRHCRIYRLILGHWINDITWRLRRMPELHPLVRIVKRCRKVAVLRRLWRSAKIAGHVTVGRPAPDNNDGETLFQEIVTALESEIAQPAAFVPGRILHVNAGLAAGGAERQICLTLAGLKRRGFCDVALLGEYKDAIDDFPPYVCALDANAIPYEAIVKAPVPSVLRRLPKRLAAALSQLPPDILTDILSLAEEFDRRRPQVVQAWQDATSIRVAIAAAIAGIPRTVLCGRNVCPVTLPTNQPHFRAAYVAILRMPGVILTNNSHAGANSYAHWLGVDADSIPVIYNAVDTTNRRSAYPADWRARLGIPEQAPVIGGIFRLLPQKRPLLWVHAAAVLGGSLSDAHFVIAGEGTMREDILRYAAAQNLGGRFHLLGNVPAVSELYAIFDVFLLASQAEGVANVLLEAQCAGVPVVCADAGGNSEAVQPDVTAIVVNRPEPAVLATAVMRVLRDKAWRERARIAGPRHVAANFSPDAMIEKTMKVCGLPKVAGDQQY